MLHRNFEINSNPRKLLLLMRMKSVPNSWPPAEQYPKNNGRQQKRKCRDSWMAGIVACLMSIAVGIALAILCTFPATDDENRVITTTNPTPTNTTTPTIHDGDLRPIHGAAACEADVNRLATPKHERLWPTSLESPANRTEANSTHNVFDETPDGEA